MKLHTFAVAALIASFSIMTGTASAQAPATKSEPKSDKAAVTKDAKAPKKDTKDAKSDKGPKTEATTPAAPKK